VQTPGAESLEVQNIRCETGRGLWNAIRAQQVDHESFRRLGLRWRCSVRNDPQYAMTCRATGRRVMRYSWLSGE
jgi:hypothetical protein